MRTPAKSEVANFPNEVVQEKTKKNSKRNPCTKEPQIEESSEEEDLGTSPLGLKLKKLSDENYSLQRRIRELTDENFDDIPEITEGELDSNIINEIPPENYEITENIPIEIERGTNSEPVIRSKRHRKPTSRYGQDVPSELLRVPQVARRKERKRKEKNDSETSEQQNVPTPSVET